MTYTFKFKTRDEYYEYKADWKKRLAEAYEELRAERRANKQYLWQYRPKGVNTVPRKINIGSNPDWCGYNNQWNISKAKLKIWKLYDERMMSKIVAGQQREARLNQETIAV